MHYHTSGVGKIIPFDKVRFDRWDNKSFVYSSLTLGCKTMEYLERLGLTGVNMSKPSKAMCFLTKHRAILCKKARAFLPLFAFWSGS